MVLILARETEIRFNGHESLAAFAQRTPLWFTFPAEGIVNTYCEQTVDKRLYPLESKITKARENQKIQLFGNSSRSMK